MRYSSRISKTLSFDREVLVKYKFSCGSRGLSGHFTPTKWWEILWFHRTSKLNEDKYEEERQSASHVTKSMHSSSGQHDPLPSMERQSRIMEHNKKVLVLLSI